MLKVTWQEFKQDLMLMAVWLVPLWPDSHADFKKRIVLPQRQQAGNTEFPSEGAGLTVHPGPVPSWPSRQTPPLATPRAFRDAARSCAQVAPNLDRGPDQAGCDL